MVKYLPLTITFSHSDKGGRKTSTGQKGVKRMGVFVKSRSGMGKKVNGQNYSEEPNKNGGVEGTKRGTRFRSTGILLVP